jgi:carboxypeptidase PM20D1
MNRLLTWVGATLALVTLLLLVPALRESPRPRSSSKFHVDARLDAQGVAEHVAAAVRIRTISHADPAEEDRAAFAELRALFEHAYPLIHAKLERELVNGDGLVYHWPGRDPKLDPILFLGHQDVVPVEPGTEAQWTHAPFSGTIADGFVWGRGSLDDKGPLVCLLEAIESLLRDGFAPERSVYVAAGFDEEVGGNAGARQIAAHFSAQGLHFAWALDEGGGVSQGVLAEVERPVASIGVAEKGYLSLALTARGHGGHSSAPPADHAVLRLAHALAALEREPFAPRITPVLREALARISPELPLRKRLWTANLWLSAPLLARVLGEDERLRPLVRTTLTPTMLAAGVKDNVVPASARAVVNLRLLPGESVASATAHVKHTLSGHQIDVETLTRMVSEPAQASPVDGAGFALLTQLVGELFADALVVPSTVNGATDARHYATVSAAQYRFVPRLSTPSDLKRVHGSDERTSVAGLSLAVDAYRRLITLGSAGH